MGAYRHLLPEKSPTTMFVWSFCSLSHLLGYMAVHIPEYLLLGAVRFDIKKCDRTLQYPVALADDNNPQSTLRNTHQPLVTNVVDLRQENVGGKFFVEIPA